MEDTTLKKRFKYIHNPSNVSNTSPNSLFMPDDILTEILIRLPIKSIFRFMSVSKPWHSLLSDPIFKTRKIERSGFNQSACIFSFHRNKHTVSSISYEGEDKYIQYKSIFDTHDGFSFRFLGPKIYNYCYYLASSNGLVLLRNLKEYIVCNPLTKQWVTLPRPNNHFSYDCFTGFVCEPSSSAAPQGNYNPIVYKVMRFERVNRGNLLSFEIYSADIGTWRMYTTSGYIGIVGSSNSPYCCVNGKVSTIINRVMYVLDQGNRVIAYYLNTKSEHGQNEVDECKFINLPWHGRLLGTYSNCQLYLGESEGLLCFCAINRGPTVGLSVWVLENEVDLHWGLVGEVELKNIVVPNRDDGFLKSQWLTLDVIKFDPSDRNIVILGIDDFIASYNFITRKLKVLHQFKCSLSSGGIHYHNYDFLRFVLPKWPVSL